MGTSHGGAQSDQLRYVKKLKGPDGVAEKAGKEVTFRSHEVLDIAVT